MNIDNFGSSPAALILTKMLEYDSVNRKKVSNHMSRFNRNMKDVSELKDVRLRKKLMLLLTTECNIDIPENIKNFLMNVKSCSYKKAIK
jgi:hypothetical protein